MRRVRDDRFDREVLRESLPVSIPDDSTSGINSLFVNVFLRCKCGVLLVLYDLKIDKPNRVNAEQADQSKTDRDGTRLRIPPHWLKPRLETTLKASPAPS